MTTIARFSPTVWLSRLLLCGCESILQVRVLQLPVLDLTPFFVCCSLSCLQRCKLCLIICFRALPSFRGCFLWLLDSGLLMSSTFRQRLCPTVWTARPQLCGCRCILQVRILQPLVSIRCLPCLALRFFVCCEQAAQGQKLS
jgi:hypothetical protein